MISFKLAQKSSLAVFASPLWAVAVTISLYFLVTLPVPELFRRRINAVLSITPKTI
jgi:hypothetical protein